MKWTKEDICLKRKKDYFYFGHAQLLKK